MYISTKYRWAGIVAISLVMTALALSVFGLGSYVEHFAAVSVKALAGGAMGYVVDRAVCGNDVSEVSEQAAQDRAKLRRTVAVVGFAIALTLGA
jgi:lipoprotein signal peptidase